MAFHHQETVVVSSCGMLKAACDDGVTLRISFSVVSDFEKFCRFSEND
jgi:hypothetical protein